MRDGNLLSLFAHKRKTKLTDQQPTSFVYCLLYSYYRDNLWELHGAARKTRRFRTAQVYNGGGVVARGGAGSIVVANQREQRDMQVRRAVRYTS